MRGLSADNYSRIETMKDRVGGLRSAREDERKQVNWISQNGFNNTNNYMIYNVLHCNKFMLS